MHLHSPLRTGLHMKFSVVSLIFTGCEANPDVNLQNRKFGIKLYIPGPDGMEEIWLRFETVGFSLWNIPHIDICNVNNIFTLGNSHVEIVPCNLMPNYYSGILANIVDPDQTPSELFE